MQSAYTGLVGQVFAVDLVGHLLQDGQRRRVIGPPCLVLPLELFHNLPDGPFDLPSCLGRLTRADMEDHLYPSSFEDKVGYKLLVLGPGFLVDSMAGEVPRGGNGVLDAPDLREVLGEVFQVLVPPNDNLNLWEFPFLFPPFSKGGTGGIFLSDGPIE